MRFSPSLLGILLRGSASTYAGAFSLSKASATQLITPSQFSLSNIRGGSTSSSLNMAAERPFNTWTFDKHCETMDWSPTPEASLTAISAADASSDDADLIIIGVLAPEKDEDAADDEDKEIDPIVFTGKAKEIDDSLSGALTELAAENAKVRKMHKICTDFLYNSCKNCKLVPSYTVHLSPINNRHSRMEVVPVQCLLSCV